MTAPERTADGRYIIVNGRRWRATDPELPDRLVAPLKSELGSARSRIRSAPDDAAREALRDRVQLAKEGLGERGTAWWEMSASDRIARAEDRLRRLTASSP
ncbi:biopolymer transporter Tol [Leucobacter sp. USCH14]|uniref:biopolymer transporter Tol n=1 Tax=Leucobacter sp. USCH14 TaxID=3024838 RepID=UPI0030B4C518